MANCLFPPDLRNGALSPLTSSSRTPPNLFTTLAWPTISSNQSSMVAFLDHQFSGLRCLVQFYFIAHEILTKIKLITLSSELQSRDPDSTAFAPADSACTRAKGSRWPSRGSRSDWFYFSGRASRCKCSCCQGWQRRRKWLQSSAASVYVNQKN